MPIVLKTRREIDLMRHAGRVGHDILEKMKTAAVAGVTTLELDDLAASELAKVGGIGMSRNYPTYRAGEGFPGPTPASASMKKSYTASPAPASCEPATWSHWIWH
jgi:methionine aminopeptidase